MTEHDPAIFRLWLMTLARLGGIAVAIAGLWVSGQSDGEMLWIAMGLLLMLMGAATTLFVPRMLLKRWKK